MHDKRYLDYLKTLSWTSLRERCFQVHGKECRYCKRTKSLQVHHLRYKNLYDCTTQDVIPICSVCHKEWHEHLARLDHWLPRDQKNELVHQIMIAKERVIKPITTKVIPTKYHNGKYWHYSTKRWMPRKQFA